MGLSINNRDYPVEAINGIRCRLIDKDAGTERMEFLKKLLEHNNFEVVTEETIDENNIKTFRIGVTSIRFHPVIAIYARKLKTPEGKTVSPNCWNQLPEKENLQYWEYREKTLVSEEDLKIVPGVFMSI
jgi:hypothetical protein